MTKLSPVYANAVGFYNIAKGGIWMSRKTKSVSFNTDDPLDLALLKHAEKINPLTGKEQNFCKAID